jgi:hypothetical protein
MTEPQRAGVQRGRKVRADVRQALLKSASAHLYPGIPPGEWQPAAVMVDMVLASGRGARIASSARDRVLDERHFEFRGRLSAGTQDIQRQSRLEDRRNRRARAQEDKASS